MEQQVSPFFSQSISISSSAMANVGAHSCSLIFSSTETMKLQTIGNTEVLCALALVNQGGSRTTRGRKSELWEEIRGPLGKWEIESGIAISLSRRRLPRDALVEFELGCGLAEAIPSGTGLGASSRAGGPRAGRSTASMIHSTTIAASDLGSMAAL